MQHMPYNSPGPGFLGHAYKPARMEGDDLALLKPPADVPPPRFDRRKALLGQFDQFRRRVDNAEIGGMDGVYRRAFDVLTSDKVAQALDLSREDPRLRDRYGIGSPRHPGRRRADVERPVPDRPPAGRGRGAVRHGRLSASGTRTAATSTGSAQHLPLFDQGVSALVEDIHDRGLDRDVTVVVWGEFGRTPKINKDAGRDHWARVNSALLFGGGHEGRPGDRLDRQAGRLGRQPAGPLPGRPGHHLPQPGHRPPRLHPRQGRPARLHPAPDRRADPRAHLNTDRTRRCGRSIPGSEHKQEQRRGQQDDGGDRADESQVGQGARGSLNDQCEIHRRHGDEDHPPPHRHLQSHGSAPESRLAGGFRWPVSTAT